VANCFWLALVRRTLKCRASTKLHSFHGCASDSRASETRVPQNVCTFLVWKCGPVLVPVCSRFSQGRALPVSYSMPLTPHFVSLVQGRIVFTAMSVAPLRSLLFGAGRRGARSSTFAHIMSTPTVVSASMRTVQVRSKVKHLIPLRCETRLRSVPQGPPPM
jgi:hypothetical protein